MSGIKLGIKLRYLLLAPLALLLVVALACGDDEPTAVSTAVPAATATAVPAATATAVPAEAAEAPTAAPQPTATPVTVGDGLAQKLTIAINNFDKDDLDPYRSGKTGLQSPDPFADFLMGVTRNNQLTNAWGWSDSWEQIDGKTWELTLRDDLKFHDGYGFADAEDVKQIADLWISDEAVGSQCLYCGTWVKLYDHIEILDDLKLRIHLKTSYPLFFNILPPIGGSDLFMFSVDALNEGGGTALGYEKLSAPGTGPWDFIDRSVGRFFKYERWDEYYSEEFRSNYREMEFLLSTEDAPRLALVQTGVAQMANSSGPYVDEIRAVGLEVDGAKAVDNVYGNFYQSYDPGHCTNKMNVRKALNLAVDADAIFDALWAPGTATRISHPYTSPFVESWDPTLGFYGYDPDEAKVLLKQEGCAGFNITVYGFAYAAGPEMLDMQDSICTYYQAVGVNCTFTPIDATAIRPLRNGEKLGSADGDATSGAHWIPSARNFGEMVRSHGLCQSRGGAVCGFAAQDKYLELKDQYSTESDRTTRIALAKKISRMIFDEYEGGIPIASRDWIWALDPAKICGWEPIDGTAARPMFNTVVPC